MAGALVAASPGQASGQEEVMVQRARWHRECLFVFVLGGRAVPGLNEPTEPFGRDNSVVTVFAGQTASELEEVFALATKEHALQVLGHRTYPSGMDNSELFALAGWVVSVAAKGGGDGAAENTRESGPSFLEASSKQSWDWRKQKPSGWQQKIDFL